MRDDRVLTGCVRVIAGVTIGTAASSALIGLSIGFEGISRSAFLADAMLLSIAALGWRGVWVLRARAKARAGALAPDGELADRSAEMTTLSAVVLNLYKYRELLKNLVLKDIKLKYRGSVFGFLWSLANPLLMMVVYTVAFTFILRIRSEGFVFSLMLGLLSWTFFASSAGHVHRGDRRQLRAPEERPFPTGDSSHRDGAVQPRTVLC